MIKESFDDWHHDPILTTMDEIGAPLSDVYFPTITICHEPKYQVDNWALPELILNFFSYESENDIELRKDFQPLLNKIFDIIETEIEQSSLDFKKVSNKIHSNPLNRFYLKHIMQWLLANQTTVIELEDLLKNSIGKYGHGITTFKFRVYRFRHYLSKFMPKPTGDYQCSKTIHTSCEELEVQVTKLVIKAYALANRFEGIGTMIRHFAHELGTTFKHDKIRTKIDDKIFKWLLVSLNGNFIATNGSVYISYLDFSKHSGINFQCQDLNQMETTINSLMTQIGVELGTNASLLEFPTFFKTEPFVEEQARPISSYPIYFLCKSGPIYEEYGKELGVKWCPQEWMKVLSSSNQHEENPYVKDHQAFCTKGSSNVTGNDLKVIFKIMKFAYHLNTVEDTKSTYDKVLESSIPYKMVSFDRFDKFNTSTYASKFQKPYFISSEGFDNKNFQPVITNAGLCFAWNHKEVDEIYKPSSAIESFKMEFLKNDTKKHRIKKASIKSIDIFLDKNELIYPDSLTSTHSFWYANSKNQQKCL